MPVIFLAVRAVRFVRFVNFPPFQALPQKTRLAIIENLLKETAVGFAIASGVEAIVIGIISPFDRFIVPLSRGRLKTTKEAAIDIRIRKFDFKTGIALIVDPAGVAFKGVVPILKQGQMAVVQAFGRITDSVFGEDIGPTRPFGR